MKILTILLSLGTFTMYLATYLAMWDYPTVAITSSIWGSSSLLALIYCFTEFEKSEGGKRKNDIQRSRR